MDVVEVVAHSFDEISGAGLAAMLRSSPRVRLVDEESGAGPRVVVLVVEGTASTAAFACLRRVRDRAGGVPTCVLIADRLRAEDLLAAIECGVAAVVPRAEADPAVVVEAILAVSQGSALLPAALQGELFAQLARLGDDLREDHDLTLFGLAAREREVLRMIADGWDTREISERLWCSVATVKNVLSGLMTRLRLKSRTHAVAYAIRTGVI